MKLKTLLLSSLLLANQSVQADSHYGTGYFELAGSDINRENTMVFQSFGKKAVAFEGTQTQLPIGALVNHKDGCEMPKVELD